MTAKKKKWSADKILHKKPLDLIPYERNPKIHPDAQIDKLAKSIEEWGFTIPILIDEKNNVIAGHGRLFAADQLKLKTVPCIVARGWSEEQRRAYVIADNKLAEQSIWNEDLLWAEMDHLLTAGYDVNLMSVDVNIGPEFSPNVIPIFKGHEATAADMENAGQHMGRQIESLSADKSESAEDVVCPYCAASFKVQNR
jgi:hypothetical protein